MHWFKHDADANMDAKLQEVLLDYGLEGYGLYWYCIELITNRIDKDNLTFELEHDARIIARNTGSTVQKVEEMMKRFVELGLFDNNNGKIRCLKLLKRLDSSMTNSPAMRDFIKKAKDVMTYPDNVMPEEKRIEENRLEENTKEKSDCVVVFEYWKEVMQKANNTKLTSDRRQKINARLKTYTVDELKQAIDECKLSDFHMGKNDRSEVYNDLSTIMKNDSVTDKHIQRAKTGVSTDQPINPLASQIIDAYNATVRYHQVVATPPELLKGISRLIDKWGGDDISVWVNLFRRLQKYNQATEAQFIRSYHKLDGMLSDSAFSKAQNDVAGVVL